MIWPLDASSENPMWVLEHGPGLAIQFWGADGEKCGTTRGGAT